MLALRTAVARMTSRTGAYRPAQWAFGRLGGGFILAYHDLPVDRFELQIDALRPNEPVHLSELLHRARARRNTAGLFAVTFDDGVGATVRSISTVCSRRHWPVTFYLPTGYLDDHQGLAFQLWCRVAPRLPHGVLRLPSRRLDLSTSEGMARFAQEVDALLYTQSRERYQGLIEELVAWLVDQGHATPEQLQTPEPITWEEVTALSRHEAIRFESHGVTHTAVIALSPEALVAELRTSQRRISEHTGRACRHYCYPFGGMESIGPAAPAMVAEVYESATTMIRGRVGRRSASLLARIPMYERDDADLARLKILTL